MVEKMFPDAQLGEMGAARVRKILEPLLDAMVDLEVEDGEI